MGRGFRRKKWQAEESSRVQQLPPPSPSINTSKGPKRFFEKGNSFLMECGKMKVALLSLQPSLAAAFLQDIPQGTRKTQQRRIAPGVCFVRASPFSDTRTIYQHTNTFFASSAVATLRQSHLGWGTESSEDRG